MLERDVIDKHCHICKRKLNDPSDPIRSKDCGGDCMECMARYAGDPDCVKELVTSGVWTQVEGDRYA